MSPKSITSAELKAFLDSTEFEEIVQKKHDIYKKKWLKLAEKKAVIKPQSYMSWNWAAFLFQEFWLAYRKMYLPFVTVVICRLAILGLTVFPLFPQIDTALNGATIGLSMMIALYGNAWYLGKSLALAEKAKQQFPVNNSAHAETRKAFFIKNGGTSWAFSLVSLLIFCALIGGLMAVQMAEQPTTQQSVQQNPTEGIIDSVRNGTLSLNPSITLRQAMESHSYIVNPTWGAIAVEEGGHVVRFTAQCDFVQEGVDVQVEHGHQDIQELIHDIETVHLVLDFYMPTGGASFELYQGHMLINGENAYTGDAGFVENVLQALYNKGYFILQIIDHIRG